MACKKVLSHERRKEADGLSCPFPSMQVKRADAILWFSVESDGARNNKLATQGNKAREGRQSV